MYQLHKIHQQRLNRPKDKIIKELTREREQAKSQAKTNENRLKCELGRVEAELSQFVMNRERSDSYYYDHWDSKLLCFQFQLRDYEISMIKANPDILDRVLYYQVKKSVRELICEEL